VNIYISSLLLLLLLLLSQKCCRDTNLHSQSDNASRRWCITFMDISGGEWWLCWIALICWPVLHVRS